MARLFECQGKQLLRSIGIETPQGRVASSIEEARSIINSIGFPVVIKAQVWTTGRSKAGGVLFADNPEEAIDAAIASALEAGPIHGLYWLPALDAEPELADLDIAGWRGGLELRAKRLFAAARSLYPSLEEPGAFLVSATRLGGS